MERDLLSTLTHFLFISPLSVHFLYQKWSHFVANVNKGTFVVNVTKILTYALWENNSGSHLLWESFASCEGLVTTALLLKQKLQCPYPPQFLQSQSKSSSSSPSSSSCSSGLSCSSSSSLWSPTWRLLCFSTGLSFTSGAAKLWGISTHAPDGGHRGDDGDYDQWRSQRKMARKRIEHHITALTWGGADVALDDLPDVDDPGPEWTLHFGGLISRDGFCRAGIRGKRYNFHRGTHKSEYF